MLTLCRAFTSWLRAVLNFNGTPSAALLSVHKGVKVDFLKNIAEGLEFYTKSLRAL